MGPDVDLSGTWKGTTSQGREIEFQVEGNNLKLLRVAWQIGFEKACVAPDERLPMQTRQGVQVMRYQSPEPMAAGRIKTRLGIGSDLDLAVSGTLAPDGSATGDFDLGTVGVTHCSGKVKATWKAIKTAETAATQKPGGSGGEAAKRYPRAQALGSGGEAAKQRQAPSAAGRVLPGPHSMKPSGGEAAKRR
jgi:hypothetical protein